MAEVLLINPPMWSPKAHSSFTGLCPPLGLGYLAACLQREGIGVDILDLDVSPDPDAELRQAFAHRAPRLVGITSLTQNHFLALHVARAVKAMNSKTLVAIGGPHVSYRWDEALAQPAIDVVVLFEGERTIVELYRQAQQEQPDWSGIAGIAYRNGGHNELTSPRPREQELDRIPHPARHLLPMGRYGRPGTIMTSRGCPMKCIFCISSTYEGCYRPRSADDVVEELTVLRHTWGLREVYLLDNVFTVDSARVQSICAQIIERKLGIRFHCVSRADYMTEELARCLKAAGCERIEIGVESGSQEIIEALKKHITLEQVFRAADLVLGAGMQPMFTFQIGSPFETAASLEKTHQLAADLRSKGAITFFSVMTPYPGTPFAERAEELGVVIRAKDWREFRTSNPICDMRYLNCNSLRQALYREFPLLQDR